MIHHQVVVGMLRVCYMLKPRKPRFPPESVKFTLPFEFSLYPWPHPQSCMYAHTPIGTCSTGLTELSSSSKYLRATASAGTLQPIKRQHVPGTRFKFKCLPIFERLQTNTSSSISSRVMQHFKGITSEHLIKPYPGAPRLGNMLCNVVRLGECQGWGLTHCVTCGTSVKCSSPHLSLS